MMRAALRAVAVAALATGLTATAYAQAAKPASSDRSMSDKARRAKVRADSALRPYTAADVTFMQGMIHHHAQAILISKWAPSHGASASMQVLCGRIINAQRDDIGLMQSWLKERGKTVPAADTLGTAMAGMAGMSGMDHSKMDHGAMGGSTMMPGMLTDAQLKQLDAARGPEFDKLFLQFMIQHHNGAIVMVKQLFATNGAGQDQTVFKFAADVNVDQTTEVERMRKMLAALMFEQKGS